VLRENAATTEIMLSLSRRVIASKKTAFALAALAFLSGLATVASIMGGADQAYDIKAVLNLLYIDGILLLLLGVIVTRRLVQVWLERIRGAAGAGLHIRIVALFSIVAVTPSILIVLFSALFLNFGMQSWFSDRVRTALNESLGVADAYLLEHQNKIQTDAFAIANNLNQSAPALMRSTNLFSDVLSSQSALRSLSEAAVVDGTGKVLARARFSLLPEVEKLSTQILTRADSGRIVVMDSQNEERLRALIKLNRFVDAYLLVERLVDPRVVSHIESIHSAVTDYKKMENERSGIQVSFIIIFVLVALLLLLAAGWVGLNVAEQLVRPISNLISAAEAVSNGNLDARVRAGEKTDEISHLGHAFNNMTAQIQGQQRGLLQANRELDERRRFTETVLAGVSAGVVGLEPDGKIYLPNRSASELLGMDLRHHKGDYFGDCVPEMVELLTTAKAAPQRTHQAEIKLSRLDGVRMLMTRIAAETLGDEIIGFVATFDDVTDLLSAQRKAAWADVARRIAHEIKNPLTPIQLSAERLRRKYQTEIRSDPETFKMCTDTIVRQVEDIGRMVDEFSAFARMPRPTMKLEDLCELCRQAVFLERNRSPNIQIELNLPFEPILVNCDSRQISRALTNILKNATESVESRIMAHEIGPDDGWISVAVTVANASNEVAVVVDDNGNGLPTDRDRLTEPYVTTREKGTGLGLAIVRKVMEDHAGRLILDNREPKGARVTLVISNDRYARIGQDTFLDTTSRNKTVSGGKSRLTPDAGEMG